MVNCSEGPRNNCGKRDGKPMRQEWPAGAGTAVTAPAAALTDRPLIRLDN